jgi:hypothetical protein
MDLRDQLKDLFPEHKTSEQQHPASKSDFWLQDDPLICKYEKRKGKPLSAFAHLAKQNHYNWERGLVFPT